MQLCAVGLHPCEGTQADPRPLLQPCACCEPRDPKAAAFAASLCPRRHSCCRSSSAEHVRAAEVKKKKSWEAEHSPLKSSWWFIQLLIAVSLITRRVMEVCVRPGSVAGSHRLTPVPLRSGDVSAQERSSKDEEPAPRAQPAALGAGDPGSWRAGGGGRAPRPVLLVSCTLPQAPWDFFHGTGTAWYSPCKQLCTDTVRRGGVNWAPLQCAEES